ncbi:TlpA disulfide reductase family protein [Lewinella sp. W8]|uniref:TlpA family protein disulfide reductase n=1 Tax=Lewinella sp. W8 TaxID=2528208 RepID=UPI0015658FF9|nr:TlpA disulfide reductase family protein [Lewinella sp. W8]
MSKSFIPALLLLALVLCTCGPSQNDPTPPPALGNAENVPVYEHFADIEGLFGGGSDTAYLVNFWATWCKPCREELPLLQRLADEASPVPVKVVLVSLDTEPSAIERIPDYFQQAGINLPNLVLTDEGSEWGKTIDRAWTGALPTTILYRGKRKYVYRRNFPTYVDLQGAIQPLLDG